MDALPGMRLPVAEVTSTLAEISQVDLPAGYKAPSELRASQMNLILHLGPTTSAKDARDQFDIAINFAQRYPCRIIVLCAVQNKGHNNHELLEAKLFTQCYPISAQGKMCCCEALVLGYVPGEPHYLANQVSIWLESDLPTYYWIHRISAARIKSDYLSVIKNLNFRRIVYDTSTENDDYATIEWPRPNDVSDLSKARLLPVRQSLGQFFSAFDIETLIKGLHKVQVAYIDKKCGEALHLVDWLRSCLEDAAQRCGLDASSITFDCDPLPKDKSIDLQIEWQYKGTEKTFCWQYSEPSNWALTSADFGTGPVKYTMAVRSISPDKTLSEALFF